MALGVEPDQIVEQFIVEPVKVGEQQFIMVGSEFLVQATVKALDMYVHIERLRWVSQRTVPSLATSASKAALNTLPLTDNPRSMGYG